MFLFKHSTVHWHFVEIIWLVLYIVFYSSFMAVWVRYVNVGVGICVCRLGKKDCYLACVIIGLIGYFGSWWMIPVFIRLKYLFIAVQERDYVMWEMLTKLSL